MQTLYEVPLKIYPPDIPSDWVAYINAPKNLVRKKAIRHKRKPSGFFRWWLENFNLNISDNNRKLRASIFHYWKYALPPGAKLSWQAATVGLAFYNYKSKSRTPNSFVLFVRHHIYKASESYWADFPGFMRTFAWQNFAPTPYVLPPTPEIDHIDPPTGTEVHVVVKNCPAALGDASGTLMGTTIQLKHRPNPPPTAYPARGFMGWPWTGALRQPYDGFADIYMYWSYPYYAPRPNQTFAMQFRYADPTTFIRSDPIWFNVTTAP